MKKTLCLLLCLLMVVSLFGCGKDNSETTANTTDPTNTTTVPETTEPPGLQLPMIAITMPLTTQKATAEDGTLLFSTMYQDIALTLPDTDHVDFIILDMLKRIDANKGDTHALADLATHFYDNIGDGTWTPFFSNVTYNPARIDEKVISLYGKVATFFGGMHANFLCISANYDLATGKVLYLSDILVDENSCNALCDAVISKLTEMKDQYHIYADFEDAVRETYGNIYGEYAAPVESWFLSPTGLTLYFSPYDIAPYSSGPILVNIKYADLEGILHPDYFPAALPENPSGTVYAELAQDVDLDKFTQFGEAVLFDGGERFVLYSDKLVTNVIIETGNWSSDGLTYTPSATVFYAASLSYKDAILIENVFSSAMPALRLTYDSNGQRHRFFITQSRADGSIILMDDLT